MLCFVPKPSKHTAIHAYCSCLCESGERGESFSPRLTPVYIIFVVSFAILTVVRMLVILLSTNPKVRLLLGGPHIWT